MALWKEMTAINDWEQILENSLDRPVLVFKHSTSCPISAEAWQEYLAFLNDRPRTDVDFAMVKVIESRPVSNRIAEDLGIKHESPQVILIRDKKGVWSASHWDITKEKITGVLR